tara:strand:+ start:1052 stop:1666 length:615 start_codon:yes stop_codon:yes gene_type:complete
LKKNKKMKKNFLENTIKRLSKLPGLGPRSARRIIFHLLKNKDEILTPLIQDLLEVREKIITCKICGNLDFEDTCSICIDEDRNNKLICVVENIPDLWALERSGIYNGKYHILGGVLSAIDGVNPRELNILSLEERVKASDDVEIIMAISATLDGQTTAHYLSKLLQKHGNKITRLAHGVPIGGELDYLDDGTISQALKGRTLFE